MRVSNMSISSSLPFKLTANALNAFSNSSSVRLSMSPLIASSKLSQIQNLVSRFGASTSSYPSGSSTSSACLTESFLKFFLKYSSIAAGCVVSPDYATAFTSFPIHTVSVAPITSVLLIEPRSERLEKGRRPIVLSLAT